MRCELVCLQRLIGQARQVGAELVAEREETGCPGGEDRRGRGVAGSVEDSIKNHAADGGANAETTVLLDDQGSGLRHQVPRRCIVFSPFEKRLKRILVE